MKSLIRGFKRALTKAFAGVIPGATIGALASAVIDQTAHGIAGTEAAQLAQTYAFSAGHGALWGALAAGFLCMLWSQLRQYMTSVTLWEISALLPGATLGAAWGTYFGDIESSTAWAVVALTAACLVLPFMRAALAFAGGFEVLAALASLLFGVPLAILGALVGIYFHAVGTGFLVGYLVGGVPCVGRLLFWYYHGWKLHTPGYLAPYPSKFERGLYVWIARKIVNGSLGPLLIKGRERLPSENPTVQGGIYGGNHQSGLDFLIARLAVLFSFRQITQFHQLIGLRSGLGAFSGAFGVPSSGGKATGDTSPIIEGGATMLAKSSNNKMLLYFQGTLVYDNVLRYKDFRTGGVRILILAVEKVRAEKGDEAAEQFAATLGIFPKAIHYWDTCQHPSLIRRGFANLWVITGYGDKPKYGATVVLGDPIPFNSLPRDPATGQIDVRKATNMICDEIQKLLIEAKLYTAGISDAAIKPLRSAKLADGSEAFQEEVLGSLTAAELTAFGISQADADIVKLVYPREGAGVIQPSCS